MKNRLVVLLLVSVLVLAVVLGIGSTYWPVMLADCVIRVHYTGFSQMFHAEYAYYAVCGNFVFGVSEDVAQELAPEAVSGSPYGDMSSTQWFTHLNYAPYLSYFESKEFVYRNHSWLPTEFGEQYRVYYDHRHGAERAPDEKEQQAMVHAAQTLHHGSIDDWTMFDGIGRQLTWYILVSNGEQMLLQLEEEALYRVMEDGTLVKLMGAPPGGGQFEYFWFP